MNLGQRGGHCGDWLKSAGRESWFAWYVAGMVAIGLAASLLMPDTRKYGYLEGSGQIER
jgi:hypothetical protein